MAIGKINLGRGAVGIAPMNVKNIKAKTGNQKVVISWQDPENTYDDDGNLLCEWKGTKLVQKIGAYPTNVYDGNLIVDNQVKDAYSVNGFEINNLTNDTEYYYALFPYSTDSVTNKNEANRITATPKAITIYGVRRLLNSTSTTWERIESAVGLVANATHDGTDVQNDFDNLYPWSDIITCDVSSDGTINSYYGDVNFSFTNPIGYIMTLFPEFWWKRTRDTEYEYIYIADGELEDYTKSEKFMLSRYTAGGSTSALNSKSGVAPLGNVTPANFRTSAKEIGNNWGLLDITRWSMLQLLYLVEYADYDTQKVLGNGISSGSKTNSGGCDSLGMKSGCLKDDKKSAVIYRGVENIYGNVFQFCDGVNITNRQAWISRNPNDYVCDKFTSPYTKLGYVCPSSDGYIKTVGYDSNNPEIQMSKEIGGSTSTYIPDYYYQSSGNCVVWVGGSYDDDGCGLWCWDCGDTSSHSSTDYCCRLLLIPA